MTVEGDSQRNGEMAMTESSTDEETNPYLALRAAKIARNEARLAELGLLRQALAPTRPVIPLKKKRKPRTAADTVALRRSPRHTNHPRTYLVADAQEPRKKRSKPQQEVTSAPDQQWVTRVEIDESESTLLSPPALISSPTNKKSVRNIQMDVGSLCQQLLGRAMEKTGKAHVVEESARRTTRRTDVHGLSFNKYCGVQEWNNDALFLWVNLGGNGEFINDFLDGGRQITWFGGSRMHDESNIILRLLRVGQLTKDGRLPSTDGIVLWCRRYCPEKRTHGPYVCMGRLAYHRHLPGSRPIQFVWSLLDYEQLMNHEQAKQCFK